MTKVLCWLSLLALVQLVSGLLKSDASVTGKLEESITLSCDLEGNEVWYIMQWRKKINNETIETLATVPTSLEAAELSPYAKNFGAHFAVEATKGENVISFNLQIAKLGCDDAGEFICHVVGNNNHEASIDLQLSASPGKTRILNQITYVEENHTFPIECKGNVGLPAAELRWYKKGTSDIRFNEIMDQPGQALVRSGCTYNSTSVLEVMMTKELNKTVFMCVAEYRPYSYILDHSSQITMILLVNTTSTESTTPKYEVICEGGECEVTDKNPNGAGSRYCNFSLLGSMILTAMVMSSRL